MGNYYGYNRVSTREQHVDRGNKSIEDFCTIHGYPLKKIYVDKQTGKDFDRINYKYLKYEVLREDCGDVLIIPEYDRLGRADHTKKELEYFKEKNIRVIFLDIPTTQMDFSTIDDSMARMIMTMINDMLISFYDCMARTELERRKKRQEEGIAAKKARGDWDDYGRPRIISKDEFATHYSRVVSGDIKSCQLQKELNMSTTTYFRYVKEYKNSHGM